MEQILSATNLAHLKRHHLCVSHPQSKQLTRVLENEIQNLGEPHLWVPTSGTQSLKWVGLSYSGIYRAAEELNRALNTTSVDRVMVPLPLSHVSGLMPYFRAEQGGYHYEVFTSPWEPEAYRDALNISGTTLSSLVPTQVFDLVIRGVKAPSQLRHVLVGGAPLGRVLMEQFRALGWPVTLSWGATETSAACALFRPERSSYELLPHTEAISEAGLWTLKGPSIATAIVNLEEPGFQFLEKRWRSADQVKMLDERHFIWEGRNDRIIKNRGEKISLNDVQASVQSYLKRSFNRVYDVYAEPCPDEREGQAVRVYIEAASLPQATEISLLEYNASSPFELRAKEWVLVKSFSRLGKQRLP
jgi:O-succinylbenzoic acid--CoA ligase